MDTCPIRAATGASLKFCPDPRFNAGGTSFLPVGLFCARIFGTLKPRSACERRPVDPSLNPRYR